MRQQYALAAKKAIGMQGSTGWSTADRLREEIYLAPHASILGHPNTRKVSLNQSECSRRLPRY